VKFPVGNSFEKTLKLPGACPCCMDVMMWCPPTHPCATKAELLCRGGPCMKAQPSTFTSQSAGPPSSVSPTPIGRAAEFLGIEQSAWSVDPWSMTTNTHISRSLPTSRIACAIDEYEQRSQQILMLPWKSHSMPRWTALQPCTRWYSKEHIDYGRIH
jgi:hypothetical protein